MDKVEIAHLKGYRIDIFGNVIGLKGYPLKVRLSRFGYKTFCLRIHGKVSEIQYHRLAAFQKFGSYMFTKGLEVRHLNGVKTDNSFDNLDLGSHSVNMMDKPASIRISSAKRASSFVKKHDHAAIKSSFKEIGFKNTMLVFGIKSKGTMSYIINK